MKRLLETKITRERTSIGDWIKSADQATLDGLRDFAARQEARRLLAQTQGKVTQLQPKRKETR